MTNKDILQIAMNQSAIDLNCQYQDFLKNENVIVNSAPNKNARAYLELPFECNLVSYGSNIVASVKPELKNIIANYISGRDFYRCFETPAIHCLDENLLEHNLATCFMAEYFLPDVNLLVEKSCKYDIKILTQDDFSDLYKPEWSNALCEDRKENDVIGVAAFDGEKMIALAGASADCESMWQIGVDVLPEYRKQGIATTLTSRIALEILKSGRVPFYCAAWSNIRSVRNAIASGFRPAWVELTVKSKAFAEKLNKI